MTAAPIEMPLACPPTGGRLLAAPASDYQTHLDTFSAVPDVTGSQILAQVTLSRLTGRGGAGFPAAIKLQAVADAGQNGALHLARPVVVANGAEGEPASVKDRHLLMGAPHLVLDGLQLAGRITGASEAFIYLRADAAPAIRQALRERASAGAGGRGGIDRLPVTVVEAATGFVAGQETAVVSRLNSGPALPRYAPVRVTERGMRGRPTLVQNVETLGHLALIARFGGAWFAELGSAEATGTFLATVHQPGSGFGLDRSAGTAGRRVWEVPHGLPLHRLLDAAHPEDQGRPTSGAVSEPSPAAGPAALQAVLIGGFHGSWLPLPDAREAPLSAAGLTPFGGALGAGVIMPLAVSSCGLAATARIVRYLADESAKQCGPCTFGLPRLAGLMARLAAGTGGASVVEAIRQTVGLVEGRGACNHPDGTARLVRSAMVTFERDVLLHTNGRCLARIGEPFGGSA